MNENQLPPYDATDNKETGCCPRFQPDPWDGQELHFREKLFVQATTRSLFHIPLNMSSVFARVYGAIRAAAAESPQPIALTYETSPWRADHYFAVAREVPGQTNVRLSGDYLTKVFEGPFRDAPRWFAALQDAVRAHGRTPGRSYFFYTTCPKCAKVYGKNYVVGIAETLA